MPRHALATAILLASSLGACSGAAPTSTTSQPSATTTPPTTTPSSVPEPTAPASVEPGSPCGAGDSCAAPLRCVAYYGIAGARGPKFSSCEIPCDGKEGCPADLRCITIADGPGSVCRR